MQRSVVTGAAGFIGQGLCRALRVGAANAGERRDWVATDVARHGGESGDARQVGEAGFEWHTGDIADAALVDALFERPVHRLYHLAGVVSGRAEADFALGKRINLDATIALLERCRMQAAVGGPVVRFVYASSIAVFGTPLPSRIDDSTQPLPTLSYGTHKRAIELLIDDYSRRGFIDGRALRLSGVLLRPPLANGALSAFNSDVIREPLAGRDYVCPVGPDATIWLTTRRSTVRNLMRLADIDANSLGAQRCLTAPVVAARIDDIVSALGRIDAAAPARISYQPQLELEAQFGRWPLNCSFERAAALGLHVDASLDALLHTIREPA
jgi:D-erythronate 2-dehydrogenase